MTNQEIFNTVAKHMLKQGVRAVDKNGACQYKTPAGNKCAFGCLIPDELYNPCLEGKIACLGTVKDNLAIPDYFAKVYEFNGIKQESLPLIKDLQTLHDNMHINPKDWKSCLITIAQVHGLSFWELM